MARTSKRAFHGLRSWICIQGLGDSMRQRLPERPTILGEQLPSAATPAASVSSLNKLVQT